MEIYETIFISAADLASNKLDDLTDKVKSLITKAGGEIMTTEKWGRRRLAYPIHRHREGFYTYIKFKAPGTVLAEMNKFYRVSDDVIRDLTVKGVRTRPGLTGSASAGHPPAAATAAAPTSSLVTEAPAPAAAPAAPVAPAAPAPQAVQP